jgi:hypothetical protein
MKVPSNYFNNLWAEKYSPESFNYLGHTEDPKNTTSSRKPYLP